MPSASSCSAARTTSSTLRLWPRCTTSTPCAWISRRMMLIAASWPSNRLAAVTKRSGVVSADGSRTGRVRAVVLMADLRLLRSAYSTRRPASALGDAERQVRRRNDTITDRFATHEAQRLLDHAGIIDDAVMAEARRRQQARAWHI